MSRWNITGTTEMKKQIFLFALLLGCFMTFAQQQIATLQHGDSISMFYGTDAFIQAHTAADNGDIITLSPGTFDTCRITKAITLRGAGALPDSNNHMQTSFMSLMIGVHPNNDSISRFEMEGIFVKDLKLCPCTSPKFVKCVFEKITTSNYNDSAFQLNAPSFTNCIVKEINNRSNYKNAIFTNSVVCDILEDRTATFIHCIVTLSHGSGISFRNLNAYNSIISADRSSLSISKGTYFNNIIIATSFIYSYNNTNKLYPTIGSVFENWDGTFSFDNTYTLKDSIANGFRGSDGSEVGIYGGVMPFSLKPSYMYVKKCNVANRSTADGKLSVDIEVVTE